MSNPKCEDCGSELRLDEVFPTSPEQVDTAQYDWVCDTCYQTEYNEWIKRRKIITI